MQAPNTKPQFDIKAKDTIYLVQGFRQTGCEWVQATQENNYIAFIVMRYDSDSDELRLLSRDDQSTTLVYQKGVLVSNPGPLLCFSSAPKAAYWKTTSPEITQSNQVLLDLTLREKRQYPFIKVQGDQVHVMIPWVAGHLIGTDNTCQALTAWNSFYSGTRELRTPIAGTVPMRYRVIEARSNCSRFN